MTADLFPADLFRTVAENYPEGIVITGPDKVIVYANPSAARITGHPVEQMLGQTPALFKSGETSDEVYQSLWHALDAGEVWHGELVNRRRNGETYREGKTIAAIRDEHGRVRYYFSIGEDLGERQRFQQRIDHLSSFDQLTGLPNRRAFLRALVASLAQAQQGGSALSVLHVDVDDFFKVNDAIGPDDSDTVLAEFGKRLKDAVRQGDLVARIGSDEFAILIAPHGSEIAGDSLDVAERVQAAIRAPFALPARTVEITASLGIACYPADGDSTHDLLGHALAATVQAKAGGGNAIRRFDAQTAIAASGRRELLGDLRRAIGSDEFALFYQPQLSLLNGAIVGLEALIRWRHPTRGMVPPGDFIPLAEETGLIVDIGTWVLGEACRQMRCWLDAGLAPIKVAVNLSARDFRQSQLPQSIAELLAHHRLEPRCLEIEITEGAMMQDMAGAIRITTQLKQLGVRLSLDDFGTGYSSLAYLSRFPIDVVKIDQSFVRDITTNPANAAIAQATIAMSHKLGKLVLAEGVEVEEQLEFLRRNDCDEIQGYFFSRPVPADDISRMLQEGAGLSPAVSSFESDCHTVLLVDDEANILSSLKRTLRREGYQILTANSAAEGFSLLAKHRVQLIISDQRMPEMNGTEFLARVKTLYPETVRMVLSGYSEISAVTDAINKGAVYRFLSKPWDDEQLKDEIRGALRHWRETFGRQSA